MGAADNALVRVPVPPGPRGVELLLTEASAALDGSGPAIALVPTAGPTVSDTYVTSVVRAVLGSASSPRVETAVAVVIATSGSTGNPRGVELTAAALTHATPAIHDGLRPCWVAALPLTSIGGFNVVVRALHTGIAPIAIDSLGGAGPFTARGFADAVDAAHATGNPVFTSLVPAQLPRLLADERGTEALLSCARVLVGGAPLRRSLASTCQELGITLSTTYGMTETAGGCVIDGLPLPGVGVQIHDSDETGTGRIVLTGPTIAQRYRGDEVATDAAFIDGAFFTPDLGFLRMNAGGQHLTVVGRVDDVVIVSGVNVSVSAVESVIADYPDVSAAAVVDASHGDYEPDLHAFIVCDAHDLDTAAVRARVAERLGAAARPHHLWMIDRLPYLPNGKIDRLLLQQRAREEKHDGSSE